MVAAYVAELSAAGIVGYCLGSFGTGYVIALLFTYFKKMGEKI